MTKVVDCFIFYNELDILKLRLAELYDFVDYFVIVESTNTFAGNTKELFFEKNKGMFETYLDKIVHVVVSDMPNDGNPWNNEYFQRNCIHRGISQLHLQCNDLIIISDCDEIPDSTTLQILKKNHVKKLVALEMDMYYYNLRYQTKEKWYKAKILPFSEYQKIETCEKIRSSLPNFNVKNGGWHFSYFGDVAFIKNKIQQFSHQEFNTAQFLNEEKIKKQMETGGDLFFRKNHDLKRIEEKSNKYLPQNVHILHQYR